VCAYSLCEAGRSLYQKDNCLRDPHYPGSINYKEIAIIKYEPDASDFNELISINNREDFYLTSVVKCPNGCSSCPFFDLELKALEECYPKLWIVLDDKSINNFGMDWKPGEFQERDNSKYYCCEIGSKEFTTMIKGLSNPQFRKRLLTS